MLKRSAVLAACASVLVLSACGGEDGGDETAKESTKESSASGQTVTCDYPEDGQEAAREVEAPATDAPAQGTVEAVITTGQGDIGLTLDREKAPCTVQSFVSLAEQGFYDDTICPRLGNAPGFGILQCGDPSGTMSGGPGYSFDDELTGEETYPAGTIAMANAGADTNGSQFFLVFADSQFQPSYTVFGQIDEAGLKILNKVAEKGDDGSNPAGGGAPKEEVKIEKVTIG
jgi:peptidyl-prolyl cis-trans isomerase B (cyclophilin B)